jgi:hypothetical protein
MLVLTKLAKYNIDKFLLNAVMINKYMFGYHARMLPCGRKIMYLALLYAWVLEFETYGEYTNIELKRTMHKSVYTLRFVETYKNNIHSYSNLSIDNAIGDIVITLKKQVLPDNFIKYIKKYL